MNNEKGNVFITSIIFIAIIILIFTFVIAIFVSHINSILYNIKLDMYSMNKSAIISVNKNTANIDYFSFDADVYEKEFLKLLKENYDLNDELENEKKLISSVEIEEYDIYEEGQEDAFTKKRCDNRVIHTVLKIKIKPIIMKNLFEDIFIFTVHEDVNMNMMKVR